MFCFVVAWCLSGGFSRASDCTKTSVGFTPLTDLGAGYYKNQQGGLYPGGSNNRPAAHEAAGINLARTMRPLNAQGQPDDNSRIVLLSIGMSNTTQEFSTFKPIAESDPSKNPKLTIVDGAQGGMSADRTHDLSLSSAQQFWNTIDTRLQAAGVTSAQVQIAWIKQADISPTLPFPEDALKLKIELVHIVQILKQRFPNIRLAYCSSRIYAGYASTALNPEPYAYQSGFAVKWLIEDQVNGVADLNDDAGRGNVKAPWLSWGPYLWADGLAPRGDGLTYACSDLADDGTHPAPGGARSKVAGMLLNFFKSDSTARLWFLASQSAATTLHIPILAAANAGPSGVEYSGIALSNLGSSDTTLTFTALDNDGRRIAGQDVVNPARLELKAGAQLVTLDTKIFGQGLAAAHSPAWFKSESSYPGVAGCFLAFDSALSVLDGADALSTTMTPFIFPEVEEQGFNEIRMVNPGSESSAVTFQLVQSDGRPRSSGTGRTISPGGVLSTTLAELFPGVSPSAADYLRVGSSRGVAPLQLFGRKARYFAALNGQDSAGGGSVLYSPQYAVGGQWLSTLSIVNLDSREGALKLELVGDEGEVIATRAPIPIAASGKLSIRNADYFRQPGSELLQGYLRISSSGVRIAGSVVFGDPARDQFAAALPLSATLRAGMLFCQVASDSTYFTGLALVNPGNATATVTIDVFDSDGNKVAAKSELIKASGRRSQALTQFFPELVARQQSSGYIRVTSDRPLTGFALFGTHNLSVLSAIPGQPLP